MWLDLGICVLCFTLLCAWSVAKSLACVTYCLYYRGVSWLLEDISWVILSKKDYIRDAYSFSTYVCLQILYIPLILIFSCLLLSVIFCVWSGYLVMFLHYSSLPLLHLWIKFGKQLHIVSIWVNPVYMVLLFSSSDNFFHMCFFLFVLMKNLLIPISK